MTEIAAAKSAGSRRTPSRRIMRRFVLDEISAVDRPAQVGATALLMKRDDGVDEIAKRYRPTTKVDGHQHLIQDNEDVQTGSTSWDYDANGRMHSHSWVRNEDGSITILTAGGHDHEVEYKVAKSDVPTEETEMDKATQEKMQKDLAKALALAALNDAGKAHLAGLGEAEAETFLAKSAADQLADVTKAADLAKAKAKKEETPALQGEEIYKSLDGVAYVKTDDPRLVAMAKSNDAMTKRLLMSEQAVRDKDIQKRADGLKHIPGSVAVRFAIVKALDAIEDETLRTEAHKSLAAHDLGISKAFKKAGVQGGGKAEAKAEDDADPEAKLDELAKVYAAEHKVTPAIAYTKVLETPEGKVLYNKSLGLDEEGEEEGEEGDEE